MADPDWTSMHPVASKLQKSRGTSTKSRRGTFVRANPKKPRLTTDRSPNWNQTGSVGLDHAPTPWLCSSSALRHTRLSDHLEWLNDFGVWTTCCREPTFGCSKRGTPSSDRPSLPLWAQSSTLSFCLSESCEVVFLLLSLLFLSRFSLQPFQSKRR